MRAILIVLVVVAVSGCAHWQQHAQSQANKYIGRPLEAMYDEYGAPVNSAPLVSGGNFVQFLTFNNGFECNASVKTDRKGIIQTISVGGQNGCITGRY